MNNNMNDTSSLFKLIDSIFGDLIVVNDDDDKNIEKQECKTQECKTQECKQQDNEDKNEINHEIISDLFTEDDIKDPVKRKQIIDSLVNIKDNYLFKILMKNNKYLNDIITNTIDVLNEYEKKEEKKIVRPSENIDPTVGVQLHKLVTKYVDEYIRPYVNDSEKHKDMINNIYAGLYEYSCWVIQQK